MKIEIRRNKAVLSVELTRENLCRIRKMPFAGKFVGSDYQFQPELEAFEYVKEHWPDMPGLDELIAAYTPNPNQRIDEKRPWKLHWEPYNHQKEAFKTSWNKRVFAWFMDMGTGKSAVAILNAAWLAHKGLINGVLILAPSGVHSKWIDSEIKKFWPDCIPADFAVWNSSMRVKEKETVNRTLCSDRVAVLAMNIEAFSAPSKTALKTAVAFAKKRKIFMVVDESHLIKQPGVIKTRAINAVGKFAEFKRILTGTPGQPFDYYAQFNFLDKRILNMNSFTEFKTTFAVMTQVGHIVDRRGNAIKVVAKDKNGKKMYRNLPMLRTLVEPFVFRVQKDTCTDLPEKIYEWLPVELTVEQRSLYKRLSEELIVEFKGNTISAPMAIQRIIRLRQIIGGFLPDENGVTVPISATNPRIERIVETIGGMEGKIIVWASFKEELKAVYAALRGAFPEDESVLYYGETSRDEREYAKKAFQEGDARFFVSNTQCGGVGLDLFAASYEIFFSNSYSLKDRLQAEDRIHRIGQTKKCVYIDCIARKTIEEVIVQALIDKREIETELTGDCVVQWLEQTR